MQKARLSKPERRDQLLDAAADLVLERGIAALSMEGVAARAGVSKALPYAHFENAEEVLAALYEREVAVLGARMYALVEGAPDLQGKIEGAVRAYFDVVTTRATLFTKLLSVDAHKSAQKDNRAHRYFTSIFVSTLDVDAPTGSVLASAFLASLPGALGALVRRDARREVVEDVLVRFAVAGAHAVAESSAVTAVRPAGAQAGG